LPGGEVAGPQYGATDQTAHDRMRRSWRHLDFFVFVTWLHADVPRWLRDVRQDV
jgi:transposase